MEDRIQIDLIRQLIKVKHSYDGWRKFLDTFIHHLDIHCAQLLILDIHTLSPYFHVSSGGDNQKYDFNEYLNRYISLDPILKKSIDGNLQQFYLSDDEVEFKKSDLYLNWCQKKNIENIACARLHQDSKFLYFIMLYQTENNNYTNIFNQPYIHDFNPLIGTALNNSIKLIDSDFDKIRTKSLIELFRLPLAVFNELGNLWINNNSMQDLIDTNTQIEFIDNFSQLTKKIEGIDFKSTILELLNFSTPHSKRQETYTININNIVFGCSAIYQNDMTFNGYLVYAIDTKFKKPLKTQLLQSLFSLTKKESETCIDLINGLIPKQIANIRKVSEYTVREHIKNIYKKTNCNNQISLMNLLCNLPNI